MSIQWERLTAALSAFIKYEENFDRETEEGYEWRGDFLNTRTRIGDKTVRENTPLDGSLHLLYSIFAYIQQDVLDIAAILLRTEWLKQLLMRNEIKQGIWQYYAAADIDLYHMALRSIFDYLANAINLVSDKPNQVPSESFRDLKNWISKSPGNVNRIGQDLSRVVLSCDWFDDIRFVRDSIIHQGATTSTRFEDERILFRVDLRMRQVNLAPEVMHNPELADFERYGGLYIGYLIAYLNEVAKVIHERLGLDAFNTEMRIAHPGFLVMYSWIESVLKTA